MAKARDIIEAEDPKAFIKKVLKQQLDDANIVFGITMTDVTDPAHPRPTTEYHSDEVGGWSESWEAASVYKLSDHVKDGVLDLNDCPFGSEMIYFVDKDKKVIKEIKLNDDLMMFKVIDTYRPHGAPDEDVDWDGPGVFEGEDPKDVLRRAIGSSWNVKQMEGTKSMATLYHNGQEIHNLSINAHMPHEGDGNPDVQRQVRELERLGLMRENNDKKYCDELQSYLRWLEGKFPCPDKLLPTWIPGSWLKLADAQGFPERYTAETGKAAYKAEGKTGVMRVKLTGYVEEAEDPKEFIKRFPKLTWRARSFGGEHLWFECNERPLFSFTLYWGEAPTYTVICRRQDKSAYQYTKQFKLDAPDTNEATGRAKGIATLHFMSLLKNEAEDPKSVFKQFPRDARCYILFTRIDGAETDVKAKCYFIDDVINVGGVAMPGMWVSAMTIAKALGEHNPGPGDWWETHKVLGEQLAEQIHTEVNNGSSWGNSEVDDAVVAWALVGPPEVEDYMRQTRHWSREEAQAVLAQFSDGDSELIKKYDGIPADWEAGGVVEAEDPKAFMQHHAPRPGYLIFWTKDYHVPGGQTLYLDDEGSWVDLEHAEVHRLTNWLDDHGEWRTDDFPAETLGIALTNWSGTIEDGEHYGIEDLHRIDTTYYLQMDPKPLRYADDDAWEQIGPQHEAEDPKAALQAQRQGKILLLLQHLEGVPLNVSIPVAFVPDAIKESWPGIYIDQMAFTHAVNKELVRRGGVQRLSYGPVIKMLEQRLNFECVTGWDQDDYVDGFGTERPFGWQLIAPKDIIDYIESPNSANPAYREALVAKYNPHQESEDPKRFLQQFGRDFVYSHDGTVYYVSPLNTQAVVFLDSVSLPHQRLSDGDIVIAPQYWQQLLALAGEAGLAGRMVNEAEDPKAFIKSLAPRLFKVTYEMTRDNGGWSSPLVAYMKTGDKKQACDIIHKYYPRAQLGGVRIVPATPEEADRILARDLHVLEAEDPKSIFRQFAYHTAEERLRKLVATDHARFASVNCSGDNRLFLSVETMSGHVEMDIGPFTKEQLELFRKEWYGFDKTTWEGWHLAMQQAQPGWGGLPEAEDPKRVFTALKKAVPPLATEDGMLAMQSWIGDEPARTALVVPCEGGGYWLDITRSDGQKQMAWGPFGRHHLEQAKRLPQLAAAEWLGESMADDIAKEAEKAEQPKSQEQADAGTQKKGHIRLHGWGISIENAKDSIRKSKDPENPWQVTMPAHYGYIKGTVGKDKDHIDVYIGEHPSSMLAFVVNQVKKEGGAFDEHKIMLGFKSKDEAIATYDKAFTGDLGPKLRKSVVSATIDQVKHWLEKGDTKKEYANLEEAESPKGIIRAASNTCHICRGPVEPEAAEKFKRHNAQNTLKADPICDKCDAELTAEVMSLERNEAEDPKSVFGKLPRPRDWVVFYMDGRSTTGKRSLVLRRCATEAQAMAKWKRQEESRWPLLFIQPYTEYLQKRLQRESEDPKAFLKQVAPKRWSSKIQPAQSDNGTPGFKVIILFSNEVVDDDLWVNDEEWANHAARDSVEELQKLETVLPFKVNQRHGLRYSFRSWFAAAEDRYVSQDFDEAQAEGFPLGFKAVLGDEEIEWRLDPVGKCYRFTKRWKDDYSGKPREALNLAATHQQRFKFEAEMKKWQDGGWTVELIKSVNENVTAEAEALLEAEDPKDFLKRVAPHPKLPERVVRLYVLMRDENAFERRLPVEWEKGLVMKGDGWYAGINLRDRAPAMPYLDDDEWEDVLNTVEYHIMDGPPDPNGELDYLELHGDDYDGRIHRIEWKYIGDYEGDQQKATQFFGGVVPHQRNEGEDPKDVLRRATADKAARMRDMLHLFKDTVYVRSVPKGPPPVMLRGIDKFCLSDAEPEPHVYTVLDLEQQMAWHRSAHRLEDGGVHGERIFKSEPYAIGAQIDWEKLVSQLK